MPLTQGATSIYCDSAEPKSIADLRVCGIGAKAAYKRPDAVRYRIRWLQGRRIIIDPARTPNAYREFTAYEYLLDREGNVTGELLDKDNHAIDSTAYALTPIIWKFGSEGIPQI